MSAMPQLNEAEGKFFESKGEEMAPALSEEAPEQTKSTTEDDTQTPSEAPAESMPSAAPEKDTRQEKFVPLQALQQERAEKKQLRDELKAYPEWRA